MKTLEIPTANLSTVTGGCAACGNPTHQASSPGQAAQWSAQAGAKVASWSRR